MPAKGHRFAFAKPTAQVDENVFQGLNVWLIAFGRLDDLTIADLSSKVLTSNEQCTGIYEDEGGPLEYDPDEFGLLLNAVMRALIPDQTPISCRVVEPHWFFGIKTRLHQIGVDKSRLAEVFTRFGVDPDDVVDYVFLGEPFFTDAELLKESAAFLDKLLRKYWNRMGDLPPEAIARLKSFKLLFWAQDGFLTILSAIHSRDELRSAIGRIAGDFGLELPPSDYVVTGLS